MWRLCLFQTPKAGLHSVKIYRCRDHKIQRGKSGSVFVEMAGWTCYIHHHWIYTVPTPRHNRAATLPLGLIEQRATHSTRHKKFSSNIQSQTVSPRIWLLDGRRLTKNLGRDEVQWREVANWISHPKKNDRFGNLNLEVPKYYIHSVANPSVDRFSDSVKFKRV